LFGLIALTVVSLAGGVLFFPLKINNADTCLFQHKFSPCGATIDSTAGSDAVYDTLIRRYLIPYGLLWWLSLGGATFGVVGVVRSLRASRQEHTLPPSET
jgi:hypothetical protein